MVLLRVVLSAPVMVLVGAWKQFYLLLPAHPIIATLTSIRVCRAKAPNLLANATTRATPAAGDVVAFPSTSSTTLAPHAATRRPPCDDVSMADAHWYDIRLRGRLAGRVPARSTYMPCHSRSRRLYLLHSAAAAGSRLHLPLVQLPRCCAALI